MLKQIMIAAVLVTATPAFADDPKFVYGKADDVKDVKKDVEWNAAAEGGIVFTTGNSETTTLSAAFRASRKTKDNKFALEGSVTYAKSSLRVINDLNGNGLIDGPDEITTVDSITAETFASKARYDRYLDKADSLYVAALASRDVPAGKDRVLGGQLGYSRQLRKTSFSESLAEIGYDYSNEKLVAGDTTNSIHSIRAFLGYKNKLSEGVDLETSIEALTNLNSENLTTAAGRDNYGGPFRDTRVNFHLQISAKIGKNLAFASTLDAHYDNRPAPLVVKLLAPGFVPESTKLDTIMKASIIYSFF
jgi:hypothetical protein